MTLPFNRRQFLVAGVAAPLVGLAAPAVWGQARRPDLRIAANGIRNTLEPINAISNVGVRQVNAVFDKLIARDFFANGAPGNATALAPGLATAWTRENDRSVVFTLREGVKFHNGQEMTAEDVAFSFSEERVWGDAALKTIPFGRAFSPKWQEPEVLGKYSVRLHTRVPSPLIELFAASWIGWIVPRDYYRELGAEKFGLKPIGTGPYKFVEMRADDQVVLEAFDGYWGEKPTAGTITFKSVPEPATRVAGLISGQYDIATTLTPDDANLINTRNGYESRGVVIENVHLFVFNQNDHAVLRDARIRRAFSLAIDRKLLNQTLWNNQADIPNGFNAKVYGQSYDADRAGFRHDPELAKKLLVEAGYNGQPIVYSTTSYYANAVNALLIMQQMWKAVGLNVVANVGASYPSAKETQVRSWSNGFAIPDAIAPMVMEYGPGRNAQTNYGWKAPDGFNDLCNEVETLANGPDRMAKLNKIRDVLDEEMPVVWMYRPFDVYGVRKGISWRPVSFEMMELRSFNLKF
jgi:peptide/nickel transport system substrate-binding protein